MTGRTSTKSIQHLLLLLMVLAAIGGRSWGSDMTGRIIFNLFPDVYSMKPDGGDLKQLTDLGPKNQFNIQMTVSFDGKQIAYTVHSQNKPSQIWLMSSDGSDQHKVLGEADYAEWAPSFAPDGSHLIFTRCQTQGPSCAIYRMNLDGSGQTAVTHFGPTVSHWDANYSPDGKTISFAAFGAHGILGAVYMMNADGTNIRRITPPEPGDMNANWSPDGKRIVVFTKCCNPEPDQLVIMDPDGRNSRTITHGNKIFSVSASWSPHGTDIVFEGDDIPDGTSAIYVMGVDGHAPHRILTIPASVMKARAKALSQGTQADARTPHRRKKIQDGGVFPKWSPAS
jgi:Tol biopolymer transport system component